MQYNVYYKKTKKYFLNERRYFKRPNWKSWRY